ncbi:MAG: tetratricopeptide repeat protein [Chitinispirillaceae bacterium]|nr:tetratricopeptide repeat protein [Chitinispirillaceae bacterium]
MGRKFLKVLFGITTAAAAVAWYAGCSSSAQIVTYKARQLSEADSLLYSGNYKEAKALYGKIRSHQPHGAEAKSAHFSLAYLNVHYKNPNTDWNAALAEFKSFTVTYPRDPRVAEALSWIRILTVIKSFDNEFKRASNQVQRLKLDRSESRMTQRMFLDSMASMVRDCYKARDSLVKKNIELENVIIDLEKKFQQAGR